MNKKLLYIALLFPYFFFSKGEGGCLLCLIQRALSLPETQALFQQVQKEGKISIQEIPLGKLASNAQWDGYERAIYLNTSKTLTVGEKICSLVFELHNALNNNIFFYYNSLASQGLISKKEYVEMIEWIEYQNALKTCIL